MVDVISTFQEDIIKKFHPDFSPDQIQVLVQMHEETRMLQLAVSDIFTQVTKLIEAMQLSQGMMKNFKSDLAKLDAKHSGIDHELVQTLNIKDT